MIISRSIPLFTTPVPMYNGEVSMQLLPLNCVEKGILNIIPHIPEMFHKLIQDMVSVLPIKEGLAYLTIDGKTIQPGQSHRRGGPHIDGNYLPEICNWGSGTGGGNGWKVGQGGRELSSEHHKASYEVHEGGMLMVSNIAGCKGWNGNYAAKPGIGGDCSHVTLPESFILEPNTVYYGSSQFIHESVPQEQQVSRTLVRITLPLDYPLLGVNTLKN